MTERAKGRSHLLKQLYKNAILVADCDEFPAEVVVFFPAKHPATLEAAKSFEEHYGWRI